MGERSDTTFLCGADLADAEGLGGRLSAGTAIKATAGTCEFLIVDPGPRKEDGTTTGQPCSVRYLGKGVGIAGGTISAGNSLQTNADGKFVVATSGQSSIAIALEDATADQQFNMLMENIGRAYPEA